MSENAQATAIPPQTSATGMRSEIAQKWPKFTAVGVSAKEQGRPRDRGSVQVFARQDPGPEGCRCLR